MTRCVGVWLAGCCLVVMGWGASALAAAKELPAGERARSFSEAMIARTLEPLRASHPVSPLDAALAHVQESKSIDLTKSVRPSREFFIQETIRRMDSPIVRSADCCPCITAPSCDDGLYCNGFETCTDGRCNAGVSSCDDQDPCTTDSCAENIDSCFFTPVAPPSNVDQLEDGTGGTSTIASLGWSSVSGALSYNVYRASSSELSDIACFQAAVTGTSEEDPGIPGIAFFYLVTAESACAESSLGSGNPVSRPAPPVCNP